MSGLKPGLRVLGIDDGPFTFGDATAPVAGVVMRADGYIEGVMLIRVAVDGDDATARLTELVRGSRHRAGLRALLLDGASLGGFNVVDTQALAADTGLPVITVTRHRPDRAAVEAALQKHFNDWEWRLARLAPSFAMRNGDYTVYCSATCTRDEAAELVRATTLRGALPEPLRMAHMVASAAARGES